MNSEELELSLRTEFEEHLRNVLADMRQEIAQLQQNVEAEFDKHKSQLSEVFQDFSARIETEKELDAGFSESVIEHLRLARDEGATITATAIAEAEDMKEAEEAQQALAQAAPSVSISELRDAINDISSKTSQPTILKALVQHAAKFTTRGAFFILKNEHFVGWRVFGNGQEEENDDQTIRDIFFPTSSNTVLGESVRSLSAVESSYGTYEGDSAYLDKLEFGQPERMFAIPLVARGRGVAVLYADSGEENEVVNLEALETLVRVAGLTVEVAASLQGRSAKYDAPPTHAYSDSTASAQLQKEADEFEAENDYQTEEKTSEISAAESYKSEAQLADSQTDADYNSSFGEDIAESSAETIYQSPRDSFSFQSDYQTETEPQSFDAEDFEVKVLQEEENDFGVKVIQDEEETDTQEFQPVQAEPEEEIESYQSAFQPASAEDFSAPQANDYQIENNQYESGQSLDSSEVQFEETAAFDNSQFESTPFESVETPQYESADEFTPQTNNFSFAEEESYDSSAAETGTANDFSQEPDETISQPVAPPPVASRFSNRNVDLPIEVSEDERRLHNDARRFARLLVSEIKLYNEQKVQEGREASDLYERLREAIDRSREMYDKRVQPPVAAKFDYFHYELVSTLAEGESAKLGGSYQGVTV